MAASTDFLSVGVILLFKNAASSVAINAIRYTVMIVAVLIINVD